MTRQMLLYERAVPLSKERHGDLWVAALGQYGFARGVNSVPVMATEIMAAAGDYAVVFARQGEAVMPAVVLGLADGQNAYLDAEDRWQARYVPAFVRRYPFVFASNDGGQTFTLCIDEAFQGCNRDGRGQRLFAEDGSQSPYLENVVAFVKQYQIEFNRTRAICERLQALDLFETMQATVKGSDGREVRLGGFLAIGRERLKGLEASVLAELAKGDLLEMIHVHLHSLRHFQRLGEGILDATPAPSPFDAPPAGHA
ncbi:MAG: multidrug transporter [Geminicoccaceae bacterium]|nr:MAG: multidrug transporter [Geminicoccaceae bacterium]